MPETTQQAPAPTAPAAAPVDIEGSLEQRMAAVLDAMPAAERYEGLAEEDAAAEGAPPAAATPTKTADAAPPPAPTADDPDKERKERLERAAALERKAFAKDQKLAQKEHALAAREAELTKQGESLKTQLARAESLLSDPSAFLEHVQEKVGAEKVAQWLIAAQQPEKLAEFKAKAAAQPVLTEVQELRKKLEALEAEKAAETKRATDAAQRAEVHGKFMSHLDAVKDRYPTVARWAGKQRDRFLTAAEEVADETGAGDWDEVLQKMEERLGGIRSMFFDEAPASGPSASKTSTPEQTPTATVAAAQARTLSNRAAAERTAILDPEELDLPFEERQRRLERRLRQQARESD